MTEVNTLRQMVESLMAKATLQPLPKLSVGVQACVNRARMCGPYLFTWHNFAVTLMNMAGSGAIALSC